jgi:hypothetical protein
VVVARRQESGDVTCSDLLGSARWLQRAGDKIGKYCGIWHACLLRASFELDDPREDVAALEGGVLDDEVSTGICAFNAWDGPSACIVLSKNLLMTMQAFNCGMLSKLTRQDEVH